MDVFVLMLLWTTGPGIAIRPPAPEHAEFTTQRKCEDALAFWRTVNTLNATLVAGKCFPK